MGSNTEASATNQTAIPAGRRMGKIVIVCIVAAVAVAAALAIVFFSENNPVVGVWQLSNVEVFDSEGSLNLTQTAVAESNTDPPVGSQITYNSDGTYEHGSFNGTWRAEDGHIYLGDFDTGAYTISGNTMNVERQYDATLWVGTVVFTFERA